MSKRTAAFTNNRGRKTFYRQWKNAEKPKAVVVIVPGLNSHSGYYENFARQLNANNFDVYAIDLPGHVQPDGERYYLDDYNDVVEDIDQLVDIAKIANHALPVFLFGHGAGGIFASVYTLFYSDKCIGLITESLALQLPAPAFALSVIKFLAQIIPHTRLVQLKHEDFSRDKSFVTGMNNDSLLANGKQPLKAIQQLIIAGDYLQKNIAEIKLPLLVLHGTADKVAKHSGSEYFMKHATSFDRQLKLYEGHYHDLLNDKYNSIIVKDILRWLNERA